MTTSTSTLYSSTDEIITLFPPAVGVTFSSERGCDSSNREFKKIQDSYPFIKEKLLGMNQISVEFDDSTCSFTLYHEKNEIKAIIDSAGLSHLIDTKHTDACVNPLTVSSFRHDPSQLNYSIDPSSYEASLMATRTFVEQQNEFYRTRPLTERQVSLELSVDDLTMSNIMERILLSHDGVCIGENHVHASPRKFVIDNVDTFVELGVKTFYLEHICYDTLAGQAYGDLTQPLPSHCEKRLSDLYEKSSFFGSPNDPYTYLTMVNRLREKGIRVVPLDTSVSYSRGFSYGFGSVGDERTAAMNFTATRIINHEQSLQGGKFVALIGNSHLSSVLGKSLSNKHIPGVAEMLGCPSINIADGQKDKLELNVKFIHKLIPFVSANILMKVK